MLELCSATARDLIHWPGCPPLFYFTINEPVRQPVINTRLENYHRTIGLKDH
jgi:hypothetical protein